MAKSSIWLPKEFVAPEEEVYLMSAKHRGDMYHFRAAMAFKKKPLILYDCSPATAKLEEYLDCSLLIQGCPSVFRVPWDWPTLSGMKTPSADDWKPIDPLHNGVKDPNYPNLKRVSVKPINEGDSTTIVREGLNQKTGEYLNAQLQLLRNQMIIQLDPAQKKILDPKIKTLLSQLFPPKPAARPDGALQAQVLVLHRDSGAQPGGAYPELDSGKDDGSALDMIAKQIKGFPATSRGALTPIFSGDVSKSLGVESISRYWEKLAVLKTPGIQASFRDIEAYFMMQAFDDKWFSMVVGFRSGGLDMFSFLGIPTVAIGLRNMRGELRHYKLAMTELKRVIANYEQPRHVATAWMTSTAKDFGNQWFSPYWQDGETAATAPPDANPRARPSEVDGNKMRLQSPSGFQGYDLEIVRSAIWYGISTYVLDDKKPPSVIYLQRKYPVRSIVNSESEAFAYSTTHYIKNKRGRDEQIDSLVEYVGLKEALSKQQLDMRKTQKDNLQDTDKMYADAVTERAGFFTSAKSLANSAGKPWPK